MSSEVAVEETEVSVRIPSWLMWPPNCCETCTAWIPNHEFEGRCGRAASKHSGDLTDARQRCAEFKRKQT